MVKTIKDDYTSWVTIAFDVTEEQLERVKKVFTVKETG